MKTCICTNCERKFEDDDELELFEEYVPCEPKEHFLGCPDCKTDDYLMDILEIDENNQEDIKKLWEKFGDTPINDNEEIDEDFYIWEKGTDRYEIWHWFDEHLIQGLWRFMEGK